MAHGADAQTLRFLARRSQPHDANGHECDYGIRNFTRKRAKSDKRRTPGASGGKSKQTRVTGIVGWVEAQCADTHRGGTMGIANAPPILRWNLNAIIRGEIK